MKLTVFKPTSGEHGHRSVSLTKY